MLESQKEAPTRLYVLEVVGQPIQVVKLTKKLSAKLSDFIVAILQAAVEEMRPATRSSSSSARRFVGSMLS